MFLDTWTEVKRRMKKMLYSEKIEGKKKIDQGMDRPRRIWNRFENRKVSNTVKDINMDSQIFAMC